jgi:hypothetical protein
MVNGYKFSFILIRQLQLVSFCAYGSRTHNSEIFDNFFKFAQFNNWYSEVQFKSHIQGSQHDVHFGLLK